MSSISYTPPPKPSYPSAQDSLRAALINQEVRFIRAKYELDTKPGTLFKTFDQDIGVNDLVIVPTDTRVGFTVNVVSEVDVDVDFKNGSETAHWIASVIDIEAYKKILSNEKNALATMRKAELRAQREELAGALFKDQKALMATIDMKAIEVGPQAVPAAPVEAPLGGKTASET